MQVSKGFSNWKNATSLFQKHQDSKYHREAVEKMVTLPATTQDIGEQLSHQHAQEKKQNQEMLLKIISCIRFLARQGLPLRGDGDETNSNFLALLLLRGEDDPRIGEWIRAKRGGVNYTSHQIQNEILKIMATKILCDISTSLQASPFICLMMDEATDISNRQQVTIVLRHVTNNMEVLEELIGMYQVPSIDSETLTKVAKDTLCRCNLSLNKLRGQCYDGASTMRGAKSGVAARILAEEPRALYTHCYGHSINLAACDAIKGTKLMKNAMEIAYEITKLIKYSPRREEIFRTQRESEGHLDSVGLRVLCPTRWTVRADSLASIMSNYAFLQETWIEAKMIARDTETKARINGVQAQMKEFNFIFGIALGEVVLRHTDMLNQTLQKKTMSAAEGQEVARMTISTLESIRDDTSFVAFWQKLNGLVDGCDIGEPTLPRKRRVPSKLEDGLASPVFPSSIEDHFRRIYFEAIDNVIGGLKDRFEQPGYATYSQLEQLLIKASQGDDFSHELDFCCNFYKDVNRACLQPQLCTFKLDFIKYNKQKFGHELDKVTILDIQEYFSCLSDGQRRLLSEVTRLVQLILVMPATNATSERSFSALRRIKSYLRSTMMQDRLNHLLVLHVHKDKTDALDLRDIGNNFVAGSEYRLKNFGKFK